ncbi:MAG: hypothetical protein SOZ52_09405 [Pyramidobacter sp.]|nr:hypothetical protein [Pyramidobacter sp.]
MKQQKFFTAALALAAALLALPADAATVGPIEINGGTRGTGNVIMYNTNVANPQASATGNGAISIGNSA